MRQVFAIIRKSDSSVMPIDLVNLCLYKKEAFRERIVRIENPCCKALDMGVAGYLGTTALNPANSVSSTISQRKQDPMMLSCTKDSPTLSMPFLIKNS